MKSFCIIGLGRFGLKLAEKLNEYGKQVMVIDKNSAKVDALEGDYTNAIAGDATNERFLELSGIKGYDCVIVCLSKNLNDSILITLLLKEMNIPMLVVRAGNEHHRRVLEKIGVDQIVYPESDMAEKTAFLLDKTNVLEYIDFSDEHSVAEVKLPLSWIGKTPRSLDIRRVFGIGISAIRNNGKLAVTVDPDTPFKPGDTLVIIGENKAIEALSKIR